jgi:hypothetical protein
VHRSPLQWSLCQPRNLTFVAIISIALLLLPAIVAARAPLAVDLIRFELHSLDNGIEIEWETGTEQDIAYFRIKRGNSPEGPFSDLTAIGMIPAEGSTFAGATYTVVDETATAEQAYTYQLYEVTLSNAENLVASATISLELTPTPEIIGGGGNGDATSTPAPTSTRSGGSTPTATTGAAANLTATPAATAGNALATQYAEGDVTATATRVVPVLGPTPTRFSFAPSSPVTTGNQTTTGVVEAAGPDLVSQVTSEAYPAPGVTVAITPLAAGAFTDTTQASEVYPLSNSQGLAGASEQLPSSVGHGQSAVGAELADRDRKAAPSETSSAGRLLLWFGFLGALFIFIGGITISIILSTRRRDSGSL